MEAAFEFDDLLLSVTENGWCVLQKMAVFFSGTFEALVDVLFETPGYLRKPRMTVLPVIWTVLG